MTRPSRPDDSAGTRPDDSAGTRRGGSAGTGSLRVADRVVEKIAAMAATEVVGVTGPPRRPARHGGVRWHGGARWRGNARRPRVDARIEGNTARLTMTFSVRYPNPVGETAERVRGEVRERVAALAGMRVTHLDIQVSSLSLGSGEPD
ncbi:Asp23/Gls24 family envelope stress response protein [Frankia gtarii]|uniref:Asp23/Gls24 family envelope stress response protein n=1 Tax=Frankia gtarii TaxID=2950102 RepID=UPI0021BF8D0F|nr:Asp23/Gls24 family envelope stress response protein [Frankia gtarii]